jgi:hypothetical protein
MLALPVFARDLLRRSFELAPGRWDRACKSSVGLIGSSLISSVLFFLVTNFAVWTLSKYYASDASGLAACYAAGVPFFRYTLAGDLCFSFLLFGAYAVAVTTSMVSAECGVRSAESVGA